MLYIKIKDEFTFKRDVPLDKIFGSNNSISTVVEKVTWEGSLKPSLAGITKTETNKLRYEEIQLFHITLKSRDQMQTVGYKFFKEIKYPCVVEFQVDNVTSIASDRFEKSKNDAGSNVNIRAYYSSWIHHDLMSPEAHHMIDSINEALAASKSINGIMFLISGYICGLRNAVTKSRAEKWLHKNMNGPIPAHVTTEQCESFKYFPEGNKYKKYRDVPRNGYDYRVMIECEELWYYFMKCEETKELLDKKCINGLDQLVNHMQGNVEDRWVISDGW